MSDTIYQLIEKLSTHPTPWLKFETLKTDFEIDLFNENNYEWVTHKGGEFHPLYGKHHSEETKARISEALIGKSAPKPEGFSKKCSERAKKEKLHLQTKNTWGHRKGCAPANKNQKSYDVNRMVELRKRGMTYAEIQNVIGCGYNTVRRYLKGVQ